ncbi:hypothetical protein PLEOSDRAFT_154734 [Pleurotus ostreatus PC15]|uniref:C2H2-type domain-containing protein n=2 Tax=Pleurotus TaxID=5320 RepID=A0A067P2C5_PLEO1|nr:hypothetical protein CCMSSC00406_0007628 [Pleurotus cornucopiae]KDQ30021.1 hypothetical protein PLEOSDRAFT_154734 [Pleurotus ostreatus PC15]
MTHTLACPDCPRRFRNSSGLTQHRNSAHRPITPPASDDDASDAPSFSYSRHPLLSGAPCDANGVALAPFSPPPIVPPKPVDGDVPSAEAWAPFEDRITFDFAHFHFVELQDSAAKINTALDLWTATVIKHSRQSEDVPWSSAEEMYQTIDAIQHGEAPWKVYSVRYQGPLPDNPPKWMTESYELCTRDSRQLLHQQLANPDFKDKINYSAYKQFNHDSKRVWSNLMSADWAWKQSDIIAKDPRTHGCMFIPVIAGSDKTTVSVATGHQEFHPVYQSPGVFTNEARRAHGMGVVPTTFLPIPKTSQRHRKTKVFKQFCRQLYHSCLAKTFAPLQHGMTVPEIIRCADGHYRRAIYGLGPYIADYPEQVWLAAIVQGWCPKCDARPEDLDAPDAHRRTHEKTDLLIESFDPGILWDDWGIRSDIVPFTHGFPRADIHELPTPDLLHQTIKGTFKDHLVTWVGEYLVLTHGEARAHTIIQDIDRHISAVPAFPGLRRFPDGRDFNQWTGDDSKALMKVYLAAIAGHVPDNMVQCLAAFLDFCYIARKNALFATDLQCMTDTLHRFHELREVFIQTAVRDDISLPRQHALKHYIRSIRLFGSPNGLCSSITESKHIKAVKEPWRRSNRFNALAQMLRTISRLDKLAAARTEFKQRGMMIDSTSSYTQMIVEGGVSQAVQEAEGEEDVEDDEDMGPAVGPRNLSSIKLASTAARGYPSSVSALAEYISQPKFPDALRRFLWSQDNPQAHLSAADVALDACPCFSGHISVYHSAVARFYAPSNLCGAGGMYQERIRSNPCWRGEHPRYDTVFVSTDADAPGMAGMTIGRVLLFFSFRHQQVYYPCALVNWLVTEADEPNEVTGMWVVKPEYGGNGRRTVEVIHLDSVARGAHLLPVYGTSCLPEDFHFSYSLDVFHSYFVNPYADHHTFEFIKP